MTATELARYVGTNGVAMITLKSGTLSIAVRVKDARQHFGRIELQVTPTGGLGQVWITVKNYREGKRK